MSDKPNRPAERDDAEERVKARGKDALFRTMTAEEWGGLQELLKSQEDGSPSSEDSQENLSFTDLPAKADTDVPPSIGASPGPAGPMASSPSQRLPSSTEFSRDRLRPPGSIAQPEPGTVLQNSLRLTKQLGEGKLGRTFLAEHVRFGGNFAVKILHPWVVQAPQVLNGVVRTVRTSQRLNHPGIIRPLFMDHDNRAHAIYYVMDYTPGMSLGQGLSLRSAKASGERPPFTSAEILHFLEELALPLGFAHKRKLFCRNLRPGHIIKTEEPDFSVRILSFGFPIQVPTQSQGPTADALDVLLYTAPELRDPAQPVTAATDVFSLGVILYQMLTGVQPVGIAKPPSQIYAGWSAQIDQTVGKATHANWQERHQDVDDLLEDLRKAFQGESQVVQVTLSQSTPGAQGGPVEEPSALNRFRSMVSQRSPSAVVPAVPHGRSSPSAVVPAAPHSRSSPSAVAPAVPHAHSRTGTGETPTTGPRHHDLPPPPSPRAPRPPSHPEARRVGRAPSREEVRPVTGVHPRVPRPPSHPEARRVGHPPSREEVRQAPMRTGEIPLPGAPRSRTGPVGEVPLRSPRSSRPPSREEVRPVTGVHPRVPRPPSHPEARRVGHPPSREEVRPVSGASPRVPNMPRRPGQRPGPTGAPPRTATGGTAMPPPPSRGSSRPASRNPAPSSPLMSWAAHDDDITAMDLSRDGKFIATAGRDGKLKIWAAGAWSMLHSLTIPSERPRYLRWSHSGRYIAFCSNPEQIQVWDLQSQQRVHRFSLDSPLLDFRWSPAGHHIYTATVDQSVDIWHLALGRQSGKLQGHEGPVTSLLVAPEEGLLLSGSEDAAVHVWQISRKTLQAKLFETHDAIGTMALSPNHQLLATGHQDGVVLLHSYPQGVLQATLRGHQEPVFQIAFAPQKPWLATCSADSTIRLWEPVNGDPLHTLSHHKHPVHSIAIHSSGHWMASAAWEREIAIWDISTL